MTGFLKRHKHLFKFDESELDQYDLPEYTQLKQSRLNKTQAQNSIDEQIRVSKMSQKQLQTFYYDTLIDAVVKPIDFQHSVQQWHEKTQKLIDHNYFLDDSHFIGGSLGMTTDPNNPNNQTSLSYRDLRDLMSDASGDTEKSLDGNEHHNNHVHHSHDDMESCQSHSSEPRSSSGTHTSEEHDNFQYRISPALMARFADDSDHNNGPSQSRSMSPALSHHSKASFSSPQRTSLIMTSSNSGNRRSLINTSPVRQSIRQSIIGGAAGRSPFASPNRKSVMHNTRDLERMAMVRKSLRMSSHTNLAPIKLAFLKKILAVQPNLMPSGNNNNNGGGKYELSRNNSTASIEGSNGGTNNNNSMMDSIDWIKDSELIEASLMTGQEAIEYFVRHQSHTPIKFVFCNLSKTNRQRSLASLLSKDQDNKHNNEDNVDNNTTMETSNCSTSTSSLNKLNNHSHKEGMNRKNSSVNTNPYHLEIVHNIDDLNTDHFYTISPTGVTIFRKGEPTETISLSRWIYETTLFKVVRSMSTFKNHHVAKCFKNWAVYTHSHRR